jgi:hypothetical protein
MKKDSVPKERANDVTYGSFNCDNKPNKEERNAHDSQPGETE